MTSAQYRTEERKGNRWGVRGEKQDSIQILKAKATFSPILARRMLATGDRFFYSPAMSTESASGYSRKNPFPATLTVNRKLTGEGSNKETRHLEITLSRS